MLNIDTVAAERIIKKTGANRVPVAETINSTAIIHGAMDNFDHEENTLSGTILSACVITDSTKDSLRKCARKSLDDLNLNFRMGSLVAYLGSNEFWQLS